MGADAYVVLAYVVLVYIIAFRAYLFLLKKRRQGGAAYMELQYLAGRSLHPMQSMCSIVAAEISAVTFFGLPALAFAGNFNSIIFLFGSIIGRLITNVYFMPKFYGKGLTIIEILFKHFGLGDYNCRKLTASFYIFLKIAGAGVRLFIGSIIVSEFFEMSLFMSISIVMSMTFLYSLVGGLRSIVQTDVMQLSVLTLGAICAFVMIAKAENFPIGSLFVEAFKAGKFSLIPPGGAPELFMGLFAGIIYSVTNFTGDQELVQKILATKSLEDAQKALKNSAIIILGVHLTLLFIGVMLWLFFKHHDFIEYVPGNKVFSYFIFNYMPSPMKGLMVASILAATMSSLDSGLNAISSVFWNDMMPNQKVKYFSYYVKIDSLIIALLILMVAYACIKGVFWMKLFYTLNEFLSVPLFIIAMNAFLPKLFGKPVLNRIKVIGLFFVCTVVDFIADRTMPHYYPMYLSLIAGLIFILILNKFLVIREKKYA